MAEFSYNMTGFKPKTSLLDRAMNNLSDIAGGLVPGMLEIGNAVGNDAVAALPFTQNKFMLPKVGGQMGNAIWSNSALPPLLLGNPREALSRANARPVDALLDFSLLAPAATSAAKLGMKYSPTRELSAPLLGYERAGLDADKIVSDIESVGAITQNAPATFQLQSGLIKPTREYTGLDAFKTFGDEIWARPTHRTMKPGALPSLINPTGKADEVQGALQAIDMEHPELEGMTYGEDLLRHAKSQRSGHEMYAQLGDTFSDLTSKIPDGMPFSHSSRLGKRVAMNALKESRQAGDVADITYEQHLEKAIADAKTLDPDIDMSTLESRLDDRRLYEAMMADPEKYASMIAGYDGMHGLDEMKLDELGEMTLDDAYHKKGVYVHNQNDANFARPGGPRGQMLFKDFLKDFHQEIREVDPITKDYVSPIEIRRLPENHRLAHQEYVDSLNAAEGAFAEILQSARHHGKVIRAKDRNSESQMYLEPDDNGYLSEDQIHALLNPQDYDIEFGDHAGGPSVIPSNMSLDDVTKGLNDFLGQVRSDVFAKRTKLRDFDDRSNVKLNQYKMYGENARIEARPSSKALPIVDRLKSIEQNAASDDIWNLPAVQELVGFVRGKNKEVAGMKREVFGDDLFNEGQQVKNEKRLAQFARGRDIDKVHEDLDGEGDFVKMQKPMSEQGDVWKKGRDEAPALDQFTNSTPGDPFRVFLDGDFDGSMRSVIDDFKRNSNYMAGHKTWQSLLQHSTKLTPREFEMLQGKVIDDSTIVDEKNMAGPFVRVTENGPLSAGIGQLRQDLRDLRHRVGDDHPEFAAAAMKIEQFMDGAQVDTTKGQYEGAAHNTEARAITKAPDEPDTHVMRTEVYRAALNEIKASQKALKAIIEVPMQVWKYSVLHARFLSWMRNNLIGAHLMVGMGGGPTAYARELGRLADPAWAESRAKIRASAPEVFAAGTSQQIREMHAASKNPVFQKIDEAAEPLTNFNQTIADDPARMMAYFDQMEKQFQYAQELAGKKGPVDLDPETVEKYMNDPVIREELSQRTNTQMVDFTNLSDFEKRYIRAIFPFYAWMKGSNIAAFRVMADDPSRAWGSAQISEVGTENSDEDFGHFSPEFVNSWWNPGGTQGNVLKTQGMNPYTGLVDTIGMGASMVPNIPLPGTDDELRLGMSYRAFGSENPLSSMNPLIAAGMEGATGKNIFFGTPIEQGSTGGGVFNKLLGGLPFSMYGNRMLTNETGPDATTRYSRGMDSANFLAGIPIAQPMLGNVRARGVDELNERYQSPLAWRELQ